MLSQGLEINIKKLRVWKKSMKSLLFLVADKICSEDGFVCN